MIARPKQVVGWREWIAIPDLKLPAIKAKIDTGARTSALHAYYLEPYKSNGTGRIRFGVHPVQRRNDIVVNCEADIWDQRLVSDSGGHQELRYVIRVGIVLGQQRWPIEMTLTDRDSMQFRMLLGRTAMHNVIMVDPGRSYIAGRMRSGDVIRKYAPNTPISRKGKR